MNIEWIDIKAYRFLQLMAEDIAKERMRVSEPSYKKTI